MTLFQQKQFRNLLVCIVLFVVALAGIVCAAFVGTVQQKQAERVEIRTTSGDASVLEDITLDGMIAKLGYQTMFSVAGQDSIVNTETLSLLSAGNSRWYWHDVPRAFQSNLLNHGYFVARDNCRFLLAEGATETLRYTQRDTEEEQWYTDRENKMEIYQYHYRADWVKPSYYFANYASSGFDSSLFANADDLILADYKIPGWNDDYKLEYSKKEYRYPGYEEQERVEPLDSYWSSVSVAEKPTLTNYLQLSATIDDVTYLALPSMVGAVGQNGVYRRTPTPPTFYVQQNEVASLDNPTIKADYEAQREAVYLYDIESKEAGKGAQMTSALIAHKGMLFLLTGQAELGTGATSDVLNNPHKNVENSGTDNTETTAAPQPTALTITVIDPTSGQVLYQVPLGSYALQTDCPPMFYENQGYLSVAVATTADYQVFSFTATHDDMTLVDETVFEKQAPESASCLQDVYFDGKTLFVIETTEQSYEIWRDLTARQHDDYLSGSLVQRMLAFQGGECKWEGALSTDIYQDHLRPNEAWSDPRGVSDLKFHQKGEVRA